MVLILPSLTPYPHVQDKCDFAIYFRILFKTQGMIKPKPKNLVAPWIVLWTQI